MPAVNNPATNGQKVLVVDDELPARKRLIALLQAIDGYVVVGEASHGQEALDYMAQTMPDILLLDIRMPGVDGLAVARQLAEWSNPPAVIFCTAYDEHALAAFNSQAVAYLLKPVAREKLQQALQRCQQLNQSQLAALAQIAAAVEPDIDAENVSLPVPTRAGIERLAITEILAFVADNKYVSAYTHEREVLLDLSLKELEAKFPAQFVRVHRNALVARQFIHSLEKRVSGDSGEHWVVCLKNTDVAPVVSRRHLAEIRRLIRHE